MTDFFHCNNHSRSWAAWHGGVTLQVCKDWADERSRPRPSEIWSQVATNSGFLQAVWVFSVPATMSSVDASVPCGPMPLLGNSHWDLNISKPPFKRWAKSGAKRVFQVERTAYSREDNRGDWQCALASWDRGRIHLLEERNAKTEV